MGISLICAMDRNRNIGLNGDMPWGRTMPADLDYFKEKTDGKTIIMGRKTFESLPRVLPNRNHIIITSDESKREISQAPTVYVNSFEEALHIADLHHMHGQEVFVIGGATVYEQFLPYATKIYITKIAANLEGDTKFPDIVGAWDIEQGAIFHHDKDKYPSQHVVYTRRPAE